MIQTFFYAKVLDYRAVRLSNPRTINSHPATGGAPSDCLVSFSSVKIITTIVISTVIKSFTDLGKSGKRYCKVFMPACKQTENHRRLRWRQWSRQ